VVNVADVSDRHSSEAAEFAGEGPFGSRSGQVRTTQSSLDEHGCAYVPETNTFLIREFRMPHVAVEAARFLHHACRGMSQTRCSLTFAIEAAVAHFGGRLLCPGWSQEDCFTNECGERLYTAYLEGRLTKAAARRILLAHIDSVKESEVVLAQLRAI